MISGKLYVLTGCEESADCWPVVPPALYRYNPATDRWVTLAAPSTRYYLGGVIGGKFYAVGWSVAGGHEVVVYDPATNGWMRAASAPQFAGGWLAASVALDGKLYVVNGDGSTYVYTPASRAWTTKARLPGANTYSVAAARVVLNGQARIEVVGGAKPGNNLQYIP